MEQLMTIGRTPPGPWFPPTPPKTELEKAIEKLKEEGEKLQKQVNEQTEKLISKGLIPDPKAIPIGPDHLCICSCADKCPLGKTGSGSHCTEYELVVNGFTITREVTMDVRELKDQKDKQQTQVQLGNLPNGTTFQYGLQKYY